MLVAKKLNLFDKSCFSEVTVRKFEKRKGKRDMQCSMKSRLEKIFPQVAKSASGTSDRCTGKSVGKEEQDMRIEKVEKSKKEYGELLLLADPSEEMIGRYLQASDMYVGFVDGRAVCEAVVMKTGEDECELKNLATAQGEQGKGYASELVHFLFDCYRERFTVMTVGTSEGGVAFYERLGFQKSGLRAGFFTKNYSPPIYENGRLCRDMILLQKELCRRESF